MARPRKAIRPIEKTICLPEDLVAQVDLLLYSSLEGKVPYGAWQRHVEQLLREDLARKTEAAKDRAGFGKDLKEFERICHATR
jgi:hypothetical protein